ncbi:hypothetical protein M3Y94_01064900 [Aphelenchoides besseyi]|nr:hypothetical protein M3Y94_01064900 [Aphelenchoides besseyi]
MVLQVVQSFRHLVVRWAVIRHRSTPMLSNTIHTELHNHLLSILVIYNN